MLTIKSSKNAIVIGGRPCDVCGDEDAVADAKLTLGPWGYVCIECLRLYGPTAPGLITNITDKPLVIDWL